MRRVRAVWDRERTSVKNKTPSRWFMAGWDASLALNPPLGHLPLPTATTIPAVVLRGQESPAWHSWVLSAGRNPGPWVTDEETSQRGAKTHPSPHSKPQQKLALAEGDGLGAIGSPPSPLHRPSGQAFSWPRAQEEGHLSGVGAGPVLGQGRPWNVVRAYLLLEHEDANDEQEGDKVCGDPHEAVLIRGLWTDGPRPASSHGWCNRGRRCV